MLATTWLTGEQLVPSQQAIPLIAYAAIAASILAPWMWVKAIDTIGADSSAMFMNLMPVVAIVLASTWIRRRNLASSISLAKMIAVVSGCYPCSSKRKPETGSATTSTKLKAKFPCFKLPTRTGGGGNSLKITCVTPQAFSFFIQQFHYFACIATFASHV